MLPFDQLTRHGRGRRLMVLARQVLSENFELVDPQIRVLSVHSFNTMFRVDTNDGRRLVLRVGDACRIHALGVEDVEAAWLLALSRVPDLTAAIPLQTNDGRFWVEARHDDVPGTRVCSLFTWVRGRPLRQQMSDRGMVAAGRLMARLHEHSSTFDIGVPIPARVVADRVVYFHDDNLVATYDSPYGTLFADAIERLQGFIDVLWTTPPHEPHLLHGDFGPNNVMQWRSDVRPIDFQDLLFGFEVQDVGITVADLSRSAPQFIDPFIAGYIQIRRWPDLSPELQAAFAAARSLNVMNLGLHLRRPGIADFLDDHAQRVAAWMANS